jgi:hemerythrin
MIEPFSLPMLHTASMNDTHFESIVKINALSAAIESAEGIDLALRALIEHTEAHYAEEEQQMLEKKFPPYPAHKEEHDASMAQMRQAAADFFENNDARALQTYLDLELIPFFLKHTETMDAVTSIFLENSEAHLPHWERLVPRNR